MFPLQDGAIELIFGLWFINIKYKICQGIGISSLEVK